ncbi:hypothetical protein N7520_006275 [Penicillium odoratum]|uniref:uncharacterized protein n=1 Tax=Penicillium odoratum TaxID=1167516 RepID=UPI00254909E5|nr:uncharacterized protein N7520_006275 [Penicillium odoratum]KAJ5759119.1 hypothetical protein N7520_006275 [Penicillium odoratum]
MPNGISKRQQLRNEKTLAELIRTVPGNDRCADCDALTPGWASWNMGLFLCMRCAAIHRKLGTHISKVKSLSMDTWSAEQVDNMKSHGNLLMNKIYNPKNIKPPVPTDVDEADSCMERFIRQKYQYRSLEDDPPEGSPPPLPPKSAKFFGIGLRTSASTSNLRRPRKASGYDQRPWSPPPSNRTTGMGAPVADVTTASLEAKMAALQELGFTNNRRNEMVLKGLNEDLDRCVETLSRLGEGNPELIRARNAAKTAPTRAVSSAVPAVSRPETTNNPFDRAVSNPIPQQSHPAQPPQSTPYNPFDQFTQSSQPVHTPQPAQPLENSFQNLQVSQPLFPHSTGGYPSQVSSMQPGYQQPYTPPVTATFTQGAYVSSPQPVDNSYNPFFQTAPQPQGGMASQTYPNPGAVQNNPFFNTAAQNQQQQNLAPPVPTISLPQTPQHANTMPAISSNSPYGTSPFGPTPHFQQQQHVQNGGQVSYNPYQQSMGPPTPQSAGGYPNGFSNPYQSQQVQQAQQLLPQATGMDKNSILSLYNLAPSPTNGIPPIPQQSQSQFQPSAGTSPLPPLTHSLNSTPQTQPGSNIQTPQQTARNPFNGPTGGAGSGLAAQAGVTPYPSSGLGIGMGTNASAPASAPAMGMGAFNPHTPSSSPFKSVNQALPRTHMSQPSVDINGLQNGRHSPDAFASLSARYG